MKKKTVITALAAALVVLASVSLVSRYATSTARAVRHGPDTVVLLCIDACRRDVFSHADEGGSADALTPWSRGAYRLQNTWSVSSWTVPAVGSVVTGLYPVRHGAGNFKGPIADVDNELPTELSPRVRTIFERLTATGYDTAAWVATPWLDRVGLLRGVSSVHEIKSAEIVPAFLRSLRAPAGPRKVAAYLHMMGVHDAHLRTPSEMRRALAQVDRRLIADWSSMAPGRVCSAPASDPCMQFLAYAAAVRETRNDVAALLNGLRESGRLDHAVIIVFADHGEAFGEHARSPLLLSDPRDVRGEGTGHGQALFEEVLDIPLYMWIGGRTGTAVAAPASLIDLVPILDDLCGITREPSLRGLSLIELLRADERSLFASGVAYGANQFAIRRGRWKRIDAVCPPLSYTFDLVHDPGENDSVNAPLVNSALESQLREYAQRTPPSSRTAVAGSETLEKLRSIGYFMGRSSAREAPCKQVVLPAPGCVQTLRTK